MFGFQYSFRSSCSVVDHLTVEAGSAAFDLQDHMAVYTIVFHSAGCNCKNLKQVRVQCEDVIEY